MNQGNSARQDKLVPNSKLRLREREGEIANARKRLVLDGHLPAPLGFVFF